MTAGHAFQHVLNISEGLDLVELGVGDKGTEVARRAPPPSDSGDGIGVKFDAAVVEEAAKWAPADQGISSANSLDDPNTCAARRARSGSSHQQAPPTQFARVERSRSTPCRAKIWLCL